jgi:predicted dehydrogenase
MRVAVLGQGSIGRRHAAILRTLGHQVVGYDVRADAPGVEGVRRAASEADALAGADAAVVASPPSEHLRQARMALEHGAHTLVEKPFAPSAQGVAAADDLARERGLVLAVAMNMRFHPGVGAVRRLICAGAVGRPLRASVWFGSWLPGWRPGSDYRQLYSARRALGGGVLLDAVHELDYAAWMLGPVVRVRALLAHESSLQLDVEDHAALILEHAGGAVTSMTLDYLDRAYNRGCRVVGEEGTVEWSWARQSVELHPARGEPERLAAPSDVDPSYRTQLEVFVGRAERGDARDRGADPRTTGVAEAEQALAIVDAARVASACGIAVDVASGEAELGIASSAGAGIHDGPSAA